MTQTLTLADGSKFVGKVDGSKQTGTLTKSNGDVYTGTFTDGKLEGKGTLKTASGNSYDGNFAGGQPSGSGTMKYANGRTSARMSRTRSSNSPRYFVPAMTMAMSSA